MGKLFGILLLSSFKFHVVAVTCDFMSPCRCYKHPYPDLDHERDKHGLWKISNVLDCRAKNIRSFPNLQLVRRIDVTHIWLSDNKIASIGEEDIGSIDLVSLDLGGNHLLKYIHPRAFARVRNTLKELNLQRTRINVLSGLDFLSGLSQLRYLDLGWNIINSTVLPAGIFSNFGLQSIFELCLCGLSLTDLDPGALQGLQTTKRLNLNSNNLKTIPNEIKYLVHLKRLSLTGNAEINLTREGLSDLNELEDLILTDMNLIEFPGEALQDLPRLRKLDIGYNKNMATFTNESFPGTYPLRHLILDNNIEIQFSIGMFGRLKSTLEILSISGMSLTKLPIDSLRTLNKLNELSANENGITAIEEDSLLGLKLNNIDLSYNRNLHSISSKALSQMMSPLELNIRDTGITSLQFMTNARPCLFGRVDVNFNNLTCDCHIEKLANSGMVIGPLSGICKFPGDVRGYYFHIGTGGKHKTEMAKWGDPILIKRLEDQCGKHRRQHSCQAASRSERNSGGRIWIMLMWLFVDVTVGQRTLNLYV